MDFFKIVYDFDFILQLLTVCVSLVIIFYPIKKTWKSVIMVFLQIIILFIVGTLLNWGLFELSHIVPFFAGINFPISWVILILFYLVFIKIPFVNRLLMGGTLFVTIYAIINLCRYIMIGISSNSNNKYLVLLVYAFIIAYSIVLRKLSLREYIDLPILSVVMMFIIIFCISILLIVKEAFNVRNGSFKFDSFYVLTLICFCLISICSYLMLYFYAKARKKMLNLQVENKLLEADRERIESYESAVEEFHLLRHDINNQMNILQVMLEKKKYDEMQEYFNSMYSNFIHSKKFEFIDCGNSLINSVINMEILKAKKNNIEIKTCINVDSELPFESSDICRILVNLIDNSIEALMRIDEKNKQVVCSILTHGEYLYIGVKNNVSSNINPDNILKMNTEKEDQANHGFGHRIVKKIANKYNGHVNYSIEEGIFYAEVMLDINYVEKEEK